MCGLTDRLPFVWQIFSIHLLENVQTDLVFHEGHIEKGKKKKRITEGKDFLF